MGYNIPVFKQYVENHNSEVHVIHWDHKKLTPYRAPKLFNVTYYKRSEYSKKQLKKLAQNIKPDIVFVSGWQDIGYLSLAYNFRKDGIPVVVGFDDQWDGNIRQRVASFYPYLLNRYFSHAWVAGPYSYEFARNLGFKKNQIIFNLYSADIDLFNKYYSNTINIRSNKYPHQFLYAGRFEHIKGIDLLINSWNNLKEKRKDWKLCFIGNGSLEQSLIQQKEIIVKNFLQPEQLISEVEKTGCFILPSRIEPFALVLHEFSAAGLPIICSDVCGAAPVFVTPKYNGYIFKANDLNSLESKMIKIINSSDEELIAMSVNSHKCSQKINPEMSAASFLSILDS
jgi:glycosyltransferase involved in cell wall biosynthesis